MIGGTTNSANYYLKENFNDQQKKIKIFNKRNSTNAMLGLHNTLS